MVQFGDVMKDLSMCNGAKSFKHSPFARDICSNKNYLSNKNVYITAFFLILSTLITNTVVASTSKKGHYEGFLQEFMNRTVSKFVLHESLTIPFNAKNCDKNTTIKESYEIPCKSFELINKKYNNDEASFYIKANTEQMKSLLKENSEYQKFTNLYAEKVISHEDSLTLGEKAHEKIGRFREQNEMAREKIGCGNGGNINEIDCHRLEPRINIYPYKYLSASISGIKGIVVNEDIITALRK